MITRPPQIGDKIEHLDRLYNWVPAGEIVGVIGNIAYTCDPNCTLTNKDYFGRSPVPAGCETANGGFIWRFHDTLNKSHRIVDTAK
jgi:hypothetical protein